jgi:transcriptional regulator with XRE-family HTH domain
MLDIEPIRRKRRAHAELPSPTMRREIRIQANCAQKDFADALGVHQETISRWERGERRPRGDLLARYVELLQALTSQS